MANDIFDKMPPIDISKLNFAYTTNLASGIQAQMEESTKQALKAAEEAYNNRQRLQQAVEQTAINTAETNVQLQKVVENQNAYIDVLKSQLSMQEQQLELDEQQLAILKGIFASGENGIAVEKEIMQLIEKQIDSSHPLWDYVKDKGGDLAVVGITSAAPVIYTAVKTFLASKGIFLP